jgi:hypothetical protein
VRRERVDATGPVTGDSRDAVVGSFETELPLAPSVASAGLVLRGQGMPLNELRVVLRSDDAEIVRRYLALHVERMEERLVEQRRRATLAERRLILAAGRRGLSGGSSNAPEFDQGTSG